MSRRAVTSAVWLRASDGLFDGRVRIEPLDRPVKQPGLVDSDQRRRGQRGSTTARAALPRTQVGARN